MRLATQITSASPCLSLADLGALLSAVLSTAFGDVQSSHVAGVHNVYQTAHLCRGFIGVPGAQPYALANSFEFDTEPITLHITNSTARTTY